MMHMTSRDETAESLRIRFKQWRADNNVTQYAAAELLCCSQTAISFFENGFLKFGKERTQFLSDLLRDEPTIQISGY